MKRSLLILVAFIIAVAARAQALYPVSFDAKTEAASLIVEGRVQKGRSFWNPGHTMIFTAWSLDIYKVFKGELPAGPVQVLTQGGFVGDEGITASELLQLEEGATGLFFLFPNTAALKAPNVATPLFEVYSSAQGFLKYDPVTKGAYAPFVRYNSVESDIYPALHRVKDANYREVQPRPVPSRVPARRGTGTITGFTPLRVHAGAHNDPANNTLTINGTGFGTASGSAAIAFDNPDDGAGGSYTSVPYNSPLITLWSNTQIIVKVPASAGTGVFNIYDNTGALAGTSSTLTVDYAVLTVDFGTGPQEANMMNTNGLGGYSIAYSTNTAGSGVNMMTSSALGTFQRALATHRQTGGVNFTDSTGGVINTTTSQTINAGALPNLVAYDNSNTGLGSPLAAGVLAVCYSGYTRCSGTNIGARRSGFDVLLRNPAYSSGTTTFTNGPCPPAETSVNELDLETVILHELGHAVNQGHVIDDYQYIGGGYAAVNPAAVMNYALLNGVKRSSYDNALLTGVQYAVTPKNLAYGACTGAPFTEMVPLAPVTAARDECSGLFPAAVPGNGATISFDLVHATANKNTDPQYTALRTNGAGTAVTNTQYFAFRTSPGGGTLTVNINNYTTAPAAQASCANGGVDMVLYNVSACPAGQAYPAPVAQRTFTGNGALAPFTGLAGNTGYLLVADGVENTKALFNAVLTSPTALPVTLTDFKGQQQGPYHLLSWQFSPGQLPQSCILEHSSDGKDFSAVYEDKKVMAEEGRFINRVPYPANNYYRLQLTDKSGNTVYSKIILLTSENNSRLALVPVPAHTGTTLYYNAAGAGRISAVLLHSSGQITGQWQWNALAGENAFLLDLTAFAAGSYILQVKTGEDMPVRYLRLVKQ